MTEEALVKKLDKTANRYIKGIERIAAAMERIATIIEVVESKGRGTKRRKRRPAKQNSAPRGDGPLPESQVG